MKRIVSMFMAVAVLFGMGYSRATAADAKPIAAVTVASYDDLIGDVNFVGKLIEKPDIGAALNGLVALATQGKGLAGLDKTRPCGAIVLSDGSEKPTGYIFLPVTDFKAALGLLELYVTADKDGDVYKLTPKDGSNVSYLKQQGAWACFAQKPEVLAHCAADPSALLGNLKKNYIVAGRVFLGNMPEAVRDKFFSEFHKGFEKETAKKDDESDADFASRKKILGLIEPYLVRVLGDLDSVVFGWGLDRTSEKTFIDLSVTAKSGTKTAEEMEVAGKATTNFAGFRSAAAALNFRMSSPIPAAKQEIALSIIEAARGKAISEMEKNTPDDKKVLAKEVLNGGADLLQKIVKSGRIDGAVTVLVGPQNATALLAGYVADGALLDKLLHSVAAAVIAEYPEAGQFIKLDAETVGGLHFHKVSIPLSEDNDDQKKLMQLIGDSIDVVIGVGKENVYVAAGRDAAATLKKAIAASSKMGPKSVPPINLSLAVKPVAGFVAAVGKPDDKPQAAKVESELKKNPGEDHVAFTVRPIANGVQVHLEVEKGLVRLFGRLVVMKTEGTDN